MIAACPGCGTRYRIDMARLQPEGAKLRCARCEVVFRVTPPVSAAAPSPKSEFKKSAAAPTLEGAAETSPQPAPTRVASTQADRSRLVLVADPEPESAKMTANALASWGLQPLLAHDGVEAILTIQRALPRVVILDAALPKMFGFQVCELMKRNESLREIAVVLVGAIHHRDRYRRPPNELYGADAYIERPELPDALYPILEDLALQVTRKETGAGEASESPDVSAEPEMPEASREEENVTSAPAPRFEDPPTRELPVPAFVAGPASGPTPRGAPPVMAEPTAVAPAPSAESRQDSDAIAQAERLARIIVSDIILYNQEKFEVAVASGNAIEAMKSEMEEGRALFRQRVDASTREMSDFLADELDRVARSRGVH